MTLTRKDESEWLVIEGSVVVGTITAHCAGCAFRIRDAEYPGGQVALLLEDSSPYSRVCSYDLSPGELYMDATGCTQEEANRWVGWRKASRELGKRMGVFR